MKSLILLYLVAVALIALGLDAADPGERPLVIAATPAAADLAIPRGDLLFVPCPLSPRNVPRRTKRIA